MRAAPAVAVGARENLLVFMDRRDVEPANNGSEQELRPSVIMRRVTGGGALRVAATPRRPSPTFGQ
jgi:Transposase IS66 family